MLPWLAPCKCVHCSLVLLCPEGFLLSVNAHKQHCHNLPDEEHHLPGFVVAPEPCQAESAEAMSFAAANCPGAETGQAESPETELLAESEKAEPAGTQLTQQKPLDGAQSQRLESPEAALLRQQPSQRLALQQLLARGCRPVLAVLLGVHPVQLGCRPRHLSWC